MAYDEGLAQRIRERLGAEPGVTEKRMFGGIAFLLHGNMAVGVSGDDLMVRVGPDRTDAALARPGTRLFDMTGRPMRGWILVGGWSRPRGGAAHGHGPALLTRSGQPGRRPAVPVVRGSALGLAAWLAAAGSLGGAGAAGPGSVALSLRGLAARVAGPVRPFALRLFRGRL